MDPLQSKIDEAVTAIRKRWSQRAVAGVILGTGMAQIADQIANEAVIPYEEIPHFPATTALGHGGRLVCGTLSGTPVVVMKGRHHLYEGHSLATITLPVRAIRQLGAELLIVSNASGGLNPEYRSGEIVIVEDHINLLWHKPIRPPQGDASAAWMRSSACPYDPNLIDHAVEVAHREKILVHRGIYVAMTGPNYETRAEYRFLRSMGGDVVGMSTVPEAIVAAQCGLRVLAMSTVTNVADAETPEKVDAHSVLNSAEAAAPMVARIAQSVIDDWPFQ